jgi:hypothetical protein
MIKALSKALAVIAIALFPISIILGATFSLFNRPELMIQFVGVGGSLTFFLLLTSAIFRYLSKL